MGKGSNPVQVHQRKERIKQGQKNKDQRIKARDDRVVDTKTVKEVQQEIDKLEKRKNLQQGEVQKLQRFQKELKLVQQAAKEKKPEITRQQQQQQVPLTELDDPRKSVYYDERMNPYGAPPPGKPRLYHQWGGGYTMDKNSAIVPGEERPVLPPPPPREPMQYRSEYQDRRPQYEYNNSNRYGQQQARDNNSSRYGQQQSRDAPPRMPNEDPPPLPREPPSPRPPPPPPPPLEEKQPLTVPALPPPSKPVQRRKVQGAVDIWASTEEFDYERQANAIDLDSHNLGEKMVRKPKKKKKRPPVDFCYEDQAGHIQGPFDKAQIQAWMKAGFFPSNTMVRSNRSDEWVVITSMSLLYATPPVSTNTKKPEPISVQDRIAALKGGENKEEMSVQDRIAALKQRQKESEAANDNVQDRIAALRNGQQEDEETESVIQDRIAALRKHHQEKDVSESAVQDRIAAKKRGREDDAYPDVEGQYPVEDSYAPQPPPYPTEDIESGPMPPPYPLDDDDPMATAPYPTDEEAMPPPPPPYPTNGEQMGAAPYPVDEDVMGPSPLYPMDDQEMGAAPYQVTDSSEAPPSYPVDDGDHAYPVDDAYPADVAYPVDDAYPADEAYPVDDAYPADVAYPVTDAYPTDEQQPYPMDDIEQPAKKKIKVDKEVVAMLPSHLRKRKTATKKALPARKLAAPPTTSTNQPTDPQSDDVNAFLEEIDGL
jgi:hypothetical protein